MCFRAMRIVSAPEGNISKFDVLNVVFGLAKDESVRVVKCVVELVKYGSAWMVG